MNASRLVHAAKVLSHPPASSRVGGALPTAQRTGRGSAIASAAAPNLMLTFSTTTATTTSVTPFPAALRRLARDGADALRPKLVLSPYPDDPTAIMYRKDRPTFVTGSGSSTAPEATTAAAEIPSEEAVAAAPDAVSHSLSSSSYDVRRSWHKPKVSRRKAQVIRKAAIRNGTYGTYQTETGVGWDAAWDAELFLRRGGDSVAGEQVGPAQTQELGRYRVTVPKKPKRQRTREQRALLVDRNLADMDERVEEYHAAKHASKPPNTFENLHKRLMRVKK